MKKIIKSKASGKTTELIQMSHDTWTYILVVDRKRADWIADYACNVLKIDIPNPVSIEEFINAHRSLGYCENVLIDDADEVLQKLIGKVNIMAITMRDSDWL